MSLKAASPSTQSFSLFFSFHSLHPACLSWRQEGWDLHTLLKMQNASGFSHSHPFPAHWWTCWIELVPVLISGGSPIKYHQVNGAVCSFTEHTGYFSIHCVLPMCFVTLVLTIDFHHLLRGVSHPLLSSSSSHLTPLLFAMTGSAPWTSRSAGSHLSSHSALWWMPSGNRNLLTSS